ncbi:MAG: hypothetical protein Fur0041_10530 [Bacteroidia bacterium]
MKFVNYVAGKALLYGIGTTAAYPYFKAELENNGYKEGAWEGLSYVYKETGNDSALRALIENRESRNAVPYDIRSEYFFRNGDWISYYGMRFSGMFDTLPLWGFVGALAITFIWLLYLYRLNFIGTIRISGMLLTVCIGVLLTMTSWSIYGFYKYVLHFGITGNMMNDFLYCIFGIGFIEELVKLIPFLIILYFTKIISRPVDYLIIASCSGLGFALFENLLYISSYGLDVIHSRALTASVAHMFSSVVLAYGFILQRFRYPDKKWIIPLFFFLASLAHGFYDFWLLSPAVKNLAVITLLFFLSEITVLSVLFNAGLNQSVPANTPSSALAINTKLLAGNIAGVFVLLFALEYVAITFVYGTFYANHTLTNSFLSGGYLVFFISLRLSSIDIVPGEWPRLDFLRSFLPSGLFGGFRRNHNAAVGLTLIFKPGDATSALSPHLPFTGKVIRRLKLKEENRWFEIQLSKPVQFNFIDISTVFVLPAESNGVLAQNEETPVKVFRLSEDPETGKKKLIYLDDVVAG